MRVDREVDRALGLSSLGVGKMRGSQQRRQRRSGQGSERDQEGVPPRGQGGEYAGGAEKWRLRLLLSGQSFRSWPALTTCHGAQKLHESGTPEPGIRLMEGSVGSSRTQGPRGGASGLRSKVQVGKEASSKGMWVGVGR